MFGIVEISNLCRANVVPGFFGKGTFFFRPGQAGYRVQRSAPGYENEGIPGRTSLSSKLFLKGLNAFQKRMIRKFGLEIPEDGKDLYDVIKITPEEAAAGVKVEYKYRQGSVPRDLLVKIPLGVRDNQKIKLKGLGEDGKNGGMPGDLYLKVKIRVPILRKIADFFKQG